MLSDLTFVLNSVTLEDSVKDSHYENFVKPEISVREFTERSYITYRVLIFFLKEALRQKRLLTNLRNIQHN